MELFHFDDETKTVTFQRCIGNFEMCNKSSLKKMKKCLSVAKNFVFWKECSNMSAEFVDFLVSNATSVKKVDFNDFSLNLLHLINKLPTVDTLEIISSLSPLHKIQVSLLGEIVERQISNLLLKGSNLFDELLPTEVEAFCKCLRNLEGLTLFGAIGLTKQNFTDLIESNENLKRLSLEETGFGRMEDDEDVEDVEAMNVVYEAISRSNLEEFSFKCEEWGLYEDVVYQFIKALSNVTTLTTLTLIFFDLRSDENSAMVTFLCQIIPRLRYLGLSISFSGLTTNDIETFFGCFEHCKSLKTLWLSVNFDHLFDDGCKFRS